MDKDTSYRLLRMSYYLCLKITSRPDKDAHSVGRDIYDLVVEKTTDADLRYQMQECRAAGWDRVKSMQYLNHRLNIGFF